MLQLNKEKVAKQFEADIKRETQMFQNVREWTDLKNGLANLKHILLKYKAYNIPIPKQKNIAKRLSQCLKEDYQEIHELALEVYDIIFDWELQLMKIDQSSPNAWQKRDSSIALYFSGLFSFYQYS